MNLQIKGEIKFDGFPDLRLRLQVCLQILILSWGGATCFKNIRSWCFTIFSHRHVYPK